MIIAVRNNIFEMSKYKDTYTAMFLSPLANNYY